MGTTILAKKKICIFKARFSFLPHWDPDSIYTGVSGSEEGIIYSAEALKDLGFKVFVMNNFENKEKYKNQDANPCYIGFLHKDDFFDAAILHDNLEFIKILRPRTKKLFFFPNNICTGKVPDEEIEAIDCVLWTSLYQRDHWVSINPRLAKFKEIFGYGINPDPFPPTRPRNNPYSCVYASDYARGLYYLLKIWPDIKKQFPKATLDIYYGLRNWGNMTLEQEQSLRSAIKNLNPLEVKDHGQVGHNELAIAFSNTSFWTYPCTHHETFCITAIKAQFAGAIPVIIENGALAETVKSGFKCHKTESYKSLLVEAMSSVGKISLEERDRMGDFIRSNFTWNAMVSRWMGLF